MMTRHQGARGVPRRYFASLQRVIGRDGWALLRGEEASVASWAPTPRCRAPVAPVPGSVRHTSREDAWFRVVFARRSVAPREFPGGATRTRRASGGGATRTRRASSGGATGRVGVPRNRPWRESARVLASDASVVGRTRVGSSRVVRNGGASSFDASLASESGRFRATVGSAGRRRVLVAPPLDARRASARRPPRPRRAAWKLPRCDAPTRENDAKPGILTTCVPNGAGTGGRAPGRAEWGPRRHAEPTARRYTREAGVNSLDGEGIEIV
jgi:hypothetical protein